MNIPIPKIVTKNNPALSLFRRSPITPRTGTRKLMTFHGAQFAAVAE
jgi:hypothetical protein